MGINIPHRDNGFASTNATSSPYFGSLREKLRHDYVLYKVNENFSITFKDWVKQPLYVLNRDIEMIKRVAEELDKQDTNK